MRGLFLLWLLIFSAPAVFSASFRNLGFEEANVQHATPGGYDGPIGELIPGWSVTASTTGPEGAIGYNYFFGGFGYGPGVSLYDSNGPDGKPQEGAYFLGLQEGISAFNGQLVHYTVEQRGDIPVNARSLSYYDMSGELNGSGGATGFQLEINGTAVPVVRLGQYNVLGIADSRTLNWGDCWLRRTSPDPRPICFFFARPKTCCLGTRSRLGLMSVPLPIKCMTVEELLAKLDELSKDPSLNQALGSKILDELLSRFEGGEKNDLFLNLQKQRKIIAAEMGLNDDARGA